MANGVLARERGVNERLVDHNVWLVPLDIAPIDQAATDQPDAHRLEIAAGDRSEPGQRRERSLVDDSTFHHHAVAETGAREGQARGRGHGGDPRDGGQPIEDRVVGGDGRASSGVLPVGQSNAKRECRRGVETGVHRAQLLKAADHQAGRDDEHEREGDLPCHQQVPGAIAALARRVAAAMLV